MKARKHAEFTVDEVSLFFNVCGMKNFVSHQRQMLVNGEMLEVAMEDVTVMGIKDRLAESKKVLESGKMMNEDQLQQCPVWRHRDLNGTLLLFKKWEIFLAEEQSDRWKTNEERVRSFLQVNTFFVPQ